MRKPREKGAAIDTRRINVWLRSFQHYRVAVTRGHIEDWIEQFTGTHRDLAARLLDSIDFLPQEQCTTMFRNILSRLAGWSAKPSERIGRWFFVPFSGSAGESGDSMIYLFRNANQLTNKSYNSMFIYRSELLSADIKTEDSVVFVDDFAGTGDQACSIWAQSLSELLPSRPNTYLALIACTSAAKKRIQSETSMRVATDIILGARENIFSDDCQHFTITDKSAILKYCGIADKKTPMGYGDLGLVLVLSHKCPNASIPILHKQTGSWTGLFPRHA